MALETDQAKTAERTGIPGGDPMPAMERLRGARVGVDSKPTLGLSGPDLTLACPGGTEMCLTHS